MRITVKMMCLLISCIFILCAGGCAADGSIRHISKITDLDLNDCHIIEEIDTHGGFLGDGEYYAELRVTDNTEMEIKAEWDRLPLPDEISAVTDMISYYENESGTAYERFGIPADIHGYYYFIDRHTEAKDRRSYEDINSRASYNLSLALYDLSSMTIYFYELDT